ncbi:uncharacterized protein LOC132557850 isoform X2 [Ylistrum balloti]|nr:uncharacterized protein LOC132557850 isoform X2 [Ylistrum balloti]
MNRDGAVPFIELLLMAQGIEPNPGPQKRNQQSSTDEQSEDTGDTNIRMGFNVNPESVEGIRQLMESLQPIGNPSDQDSPNSEGAVAVAIPGQSGAVAMPTNVTPVAVFQYVDNRNYKEEINVENMKVKRAENVNTGEQTVIHAGPANGSEVHSTPKLKKKSPKRILLEDNAETMLKRHIEETANILVTRTAAEKAVVERIKDYHMVVISGVTGEGKTTLGREICKKLRDGNLDESINCKTPVLITVPQDWSDVVNDKDDIVVFVDDIFGKTNYQTGLLNGWSPFFDRILQCLHKGNVCLVMTSRTHILKDARRESGVLSEMISDHILSEKKTVDLTVDHKLTYNERLDIYNKHSNQRQAGGHVMSTMLLTYHEIRRFPSNISIGFAQICNLFFTNDTFFEKGEKFFRNPLRMLTEEIERMRLTEPHKYFALVYCFLNDQTLDSRKLNRLKMEKDDYENLKVLAEVCGVIHTGNVLAMLKDGLNALDRTYLTRQNTVFTFGHQSIADSVSLVFGKENPELILEKCSNRVILEQLDVSGAEKPDMCTLHVPPDSFHHLVKRMCKMILEDNDYNRITLKSFPRFRNQKFADCLFEYITTTHDVAKGFLRANSTLLDSCENNVFFLRSYFKFKVDELTVKENGILAFTRALQRTLMSSLEHKNTESMSILLSNGAFCTTKCLQLAISSNDVNLVEFVLSKNTWTKSEVNETISDNTPGDLCDTLERTASMCKVQLLWSQYKQQKTYMIEKIKNLSNWSPKDMAKSAEKMDFDSLHAIFQTCELQEHYYHLFEIILNSKHKRLSDAIAVKRILGHMDGGIVKRALQSCNLDIFRFLLFSSNVDTAQLNSMVSEAIHLNKTDHLEVLIKAGGQPSHDAFVRKAGTNFVGVEDVVGTIMETVSWTQTQLNDALDEAIKSGSYASIKILFEGGARFMADALVNVSKRQYDPLIISEEEMTFEEELQLLIEMLNGNKKEEEENVPVTVSFVFSKHKWVPRQITEALNVAVEWGPLGTVKFLENNGGTFQSGALLAAVRRTRDTLKTVKFVRKSEKWSVDQLSDALHESLVLCRSDVALYLFTMGGQFNDSSLLNVLGWHVEHHVQIRLLKIILLSRTWSPDLLAEAIQFACETNGPSIYAILGVPEISGILDKDILLNLPEVQELKKTKIQFLKCEGMTDELTIVLNKEIKEGCIDIVEHLTREMNIPCDNDSLSNAMDNTRNYQSYNRLKMVSLVQESRDWSDDLLMKALDKAVKLGYTDVIFYLHDHGAMFSDQSLEYAIVDKNMAYDTYGLVIYMMKSRQYNKQQMDNALQKSLEVGHFQLVSMFHERGAEFTGKSLQNAIHKMWKTTERLPAVQFVLRAREWDAIEKNDALLSAVRLGDVRVIGCLLRCGGEVSNRCLSEILHKKCKPSHRLSIIRLLLSGSTSLSQELLRNALEKARKLSEPKVEEYIQQLVC